MLARPDIDGVVLAVPDHWHYPMASQAMLAGKDVYLEKPMTRTLDEAAKLHDMVGKTGRLLQLGGSGPARSCIGRSTTTSRPARWARLSGG